MDTGEIIRVHGETKSQRETARRLGVSEQTVYQHLKRHRGVCMRCSNTVLPGNRYCPTCQKALRERMRVKRAQRRHFGICEACDKPRTPLSRQFCEEHRILGLEGSRRYHEKKTRAAHGGLPNAYNKRRELRRRYGQPAVDLWEKYEGTCMMCGIQHAERAVHLHHIDENHDNNEGANLTLLCQNCHKATHSILALPTSAWIWLKATYPHLPVTET